MEWGTWEGQVSSLCQEDPLAEGVATHSSILAWRIPWTEEADRLHSKSLFIIVGIIATCVRPT